MQFLTKKNEILNILTVQLNLYYSNKYIFEHLISSSLQTFRMVV